MGRSYLAQSRSDRSITSTIVPSTIVRFPADSAAARSQHAMAASAAADALADLSADTSQSSHDSEEDESNDSECSDDEDDDSILTGTFGSRFKRFCWALCCACFDCCCRCVHLRKKIRQAECCLCCRTSRPSDHPLQLTGVSRGAIKELTSLQEYQYPPGCWGATVRRAHITRAKWIRFRNYIRSTLEFAENGNPVYSFHILLKKDNWDSFLLFGAKPIHYAYQKFSLVWHKDP